MSRADATGSPTSSFARYIVRSGWAHLLLLTGTLIFLFPFVWMILTSLKTDDELAEGGGMPTLPTFRAVSPYARPAPEIIRPADLDPATWDTALPALLTTARRAVGESAAGQSFRMGDDEQRFNAAAAVLINRLAGRISKSAWSGGPEASAGAFAALLAPDLVAAALDDRTASLEFRGLQVRTLDADVFNIGQGAEMANLFRVESDPATRNDSSKLPRAVEIHRTPDAAVLSYHFRDASDPPLILRADFDFPADPAQLHKLILALRPDDSWHRLDATLDVGGIRWVSARSTSLSQHRSQSILFQPPSFDDTTMQPKTWVPMKREKIDGEAEAAIAKKPTGSVTALSAHRATLRITITPTSTFRAATAKILRNYSRAFYAVPFWRYVANSVLLVALTTLGTLFSSTFVAYAFARLHWPGRGVALVILLATMMLPAQVTMVPGFLIWRSVGWYNTLNPLWVPAFFGGAFFIFLMTQHMKTLPRELEESARLDGLNAVQTWYYIILPQVKPAAAAVAIMTFMWSWNEFLGPLIYLRDQSRFPLSLGLFALRLENFGDWPLIMAANVLMTLPVIVIFFLCQRYFIQGMSMSGMK